jgi:hypothetical protein
MAILTALLLGWAEAQEYDAYTVYAVTAQNADQSDADGATTTRPRAAYEPAEEDESKVANVEPSYPEPDYANLWAPSVLTLLLSLGFFLFTAVAAFGAWKLLRTRRLLGKRYEPLVHHDQSDFYVNHDQFRLREQEETSETEVAEPAAEERTLEPAAEPMPKSLVASKETQAPLQPDGDLSNIGLHLTLREVAERLGVSVEAARALVEASLRSNRAGAATSRPSSYPSRALGFRKLKEEAV